MREHNDPTIDCMRHTNARSRHPNGSRDPRGKGGRDGKPPEEEAFAAPSAGASLGVGAYVVICAVACAVICAVRTAPRRPGGGKFGREVDYEPIGMKVASFANV